MVTGVENPGKGHLLALSGVLVISPDSLLIRLMGVSHWTILFGRGALSAIGLTALTYVLARRQDTTTGRLFRSLGRPGLLVAALSATANLLFVISVTHTHVANTFAIFAASPLLAAILSWVFLGERVSKQTWLASLTVLGSVALIIFQSIHETNLIGDLAAFSATFFLAMQLIVIRRNRGNNMVPAFAGAGLISALIFVWPASLTTVATSDILFLILDGLFVMPIAIAFIMLAPRYSPAPGVALILLLEMILAPLWVWWILEEVPPNTTILAGCIIIAAIALHVGYSRGREDVISG